MCVGDRRPQSHAATSTHDLPPAWHMRSALLCFCYVLCCILYDACRGVCKVEAHAAHDVACSSNILLLRLCCWQYLVAWHQARRHACRVPAQRRGTPRPAACIGATAEAEAPTASRRGSPRTTIPITITRSARSPRQATMGQAPALRAQGAAAAPEPRSTRRRSATCRLSGSRRCRTVRPG